MISRAIERHPARRLLGRLWPILAIGLFAGVRPARADPFFYVERGAEWRFFRGLEPASSPARAWRETGYDASSWRTGPAPFGYGDGPFGTDLENLDPTMQFNYSTLFLRHTFELSDPSRVEALEVNIDYDDGFILWVNGTEVLRANAPEEPVAFDDFAPGGHESGTYESFELPDPGAFLVEGTNLVAVQGFNINLTSSDFKLDLELFDPLGPDLASPTVSSVSPFPGSTVRALDEVEVVFSEAVTGVDAADLVAGGAAGSSVAGDGAGPYVFVLQEPGAGEVQVRWADGHGITDTSENRNPFSGDAWSYTLDPDAPEADVAINELLASNSQGVRDEDGDRSDWFELVNRGAVAVDLGGWSITDDPDDRLQWVLPSRLLGPGEYLVVFASGKDRRPAQGELHTNFKLDAGGESVALFPPGAPATPASAFAPYPEQRSDIAYGLRALGEPSYLDPPTPGASNDTAQALAAITEAPVFSEPHGFYDEPFFLELFRGTPGSEIVFTLDGTEPGEAAGTLYEEPIEIGSAPRRAVVHVRAAAFREGFVPSESVTRTYIFPEDVLTQPAAPEGFPADWGSAPAADYAMDPEVVGQEEETILEGLGSIPTLSIVMDTDDMFGPGGLYSNPGGSGEGWERPCSAELIFPDGREGFQVNCGVRIHGGASRQPDKSPKHSVRLLFKGIYGPAQLRFPFFPESPVEVFDTITFRANYNNSWIHWDSGQRRRGTLMRDQFARDTQIAMSGTSAHGRFVHLYLNGLYWGVYNPTERPSAPFGAAHFGGEKEEYDSLNSGEVKDGNRSAWEQMIQIAQGGLGTPERYRMIQEYLDVPQFIDYMIMNLYGANDDWPSHNWYAVRRRRPGATFKFISWDAERILEGVSSDKTGVDSGDSPGLLYARLRQNPEFRLLFADHLQRHLFEEGALTPGQVIERWRRRKETLRTAVTAESARWGDYRRDVHSWRNGPYEFYRRATHWFREHDRLEESYFPRRTQILLGQFRRIGLFPPVAAPVFSRHGGQVGPGTTVELRPGDDSGATLLFTTDGSDPRQPGSGDVSPAAQEAVEPIEIDDQVRVKARALADGTWSALSEANFTVVRPEEALRITELMYNAPGGPAEDFIELYNAAGATVDLSGLRFADGIEFAFAPETTLAPDEHLVLAADAEGFSVRYPDVEVAGVYLGGLSAGGERVALETEDGEVVLAVEYNDGDAWPLGPDGFGWSLVLGDLNAGGQGPGSWRESAERGGSPGRADPAPGPRGVLVSEVLAHSAPPFEDAIELVNPTDRAISIGGWYLSDSRADATRLRKYRIPSGTTLPAGGRTVFYEAEFNEDPKAPESFAIGSSGDDVYLAAADASGELTGYITGADFGATSENVSLGLVPTSAGPEFTMLARQTFGVDSPASVEAFRGGTGAPNAEPLAGEVVIHEVHYHPPLGVEFLELHNPGPEDVSLYDPGLARGWRLEGLRGAGSAEPFEFGPERVVPAGGFLVLAPVEPEAFRSLVPLPVDAEVDGPYGGALANGGERLRLSKPAVDDAAIVYVAVDEVRYDDREPWPESPDGDGPSLERVDALAYADEPLNWLPSEVGGGTPGAPNTASDPGVNREPRASFTVAPGADERTLIFDGSGSTDPDGTIASFAWEFGDGETGSGEVVSHRFPSQGAFPVVLRVTDDQGAVASASRSVTVSGPAPGGGQVPGDANQDAILDLSDAISVLQRLFLAADAPLPCDGPSLQGGGNLALVDVNADAAVDITDAVYILDFLFLSGPAPALGTDCVRIEGCPEVCTP